MPSLARKDKETISHVLGVWQYLSEIISWQGVGHRTEVVIAIVPTVLAWTARCGSPQQQWTAHLYSKMVSSWRCLSCRLTVLLASFLSISGSACALEAVLAAASANAFPRKSSTEAAPLQTLSKLRWPFTFFASVALLCFAQASTQSIQMSPLPLVRKDAILSPSPSWMCVSPLTA